MLVVVLLALAVVARARPSATVGGTLDPSDLADIALVEEDVARIKRSGLGSGSGSFDLLGGLKKTILSGIGSASASLVAGSSSSSLSSGSGHSSSSGGSSGHSSGYGSSGHSYEKPHVSHTPRHRRPLHRTDRTAARQRSAEHLRGLQSVPGA
ncbi:hypothetical protein AND_001316 [Anopheles darlingi]|uniref:Secreted protein n=1 Tax=Anopheles darlingi TaxID=43151 RepID=W5JR62_ANODA|nr:hypothetical protein AND_001316 [Anopheles darlingi]